MRRVSLVLLLVAVGCGDDDDDDDVSDAGVDGGIVQTLPACEDTEPAGTMSLG